MHASMKYTAIAHAHTHTHTDTKTKARQGTQRHEAQDTSPTHKTKSTKIVQNQSRRTARRHAHSDMHTAHTHTHTQTRTNKIQLPHTNALTHTHTNASHKEREREREKWHISHIHCTHYDARTQSTQVHGTRKHALKSRQTIQKCSHTQTHKSTEPRTLDTRTEFRSGFCFSIKSSELVSRFIWLLLGDIFHFCLLWFSG